MAPKSLLVCLLVGLAAAPTGLQAGELPFDLDVGLYRAAGNRTRLEVYLEISRRQIAYKQERGQYAARLAAVVLLKQRGQIVDFREMSIDDVTDRFGDGPRGAISRQATFTLLPGAYELHVALEDWQGNQSDSTLQVEVPAYRDLRLQMSTVQLGHLIRRGSRRKEFFKQGLTVWPSAGTVYDETHPLLWHYAEVYGLTPLDTVEVRTVVWRDGMEVISLGPRQTPSPALVYSDWGALNLGALEAGDYRLVVTIAVGGDTTSAAKSFRVVRGAPAPADTGDGLAVLSSAEMMDFARGLSLVRPELDMERFRSGDTTVRRRMIGAVATWLARELRQDSSAYPGKLLRRWAAVKDYDRGWRSRGRLTEQGRIMFLYGPPASIETYPATSTLREHHVWTYTAPDSTNRFVFMDRQGYGEFTLVHATVPGEVQNERWRRELPWVPVPADTAAAIEQARGDTTLMDTALVRPPVTPAPVAPGPAASSDTLAADTSAVGPAPPDTTAPDTTSADTLPLEIDTPQTP